MSWIEQIKNGLVITTGDGKIWTPLFFDAPITEEFNVAEFMFPNIEGTLVKKSESKGRRHTIDFHFQGDDHLDVYEQFRLSTKDKRPWIISHPMHGQLTVQVPSLTYDTTGLNITKITASLIETITEDAPKSSIGAKNQIAKDLELFGEVSDSAFELNIDSGSDSYNLLSSNLTDVYNESASIKKTDLQSNEYFNLFKKAESALLNVTSDPLLAIQGMKDVINYPSFFATTVRTRFDLLISQFSSLSDGIANLITPNDKLIYENNAGALIGAIANAISTPLNDDDYGNAVDVLDIVNDFISAYNQYQLNLDTLQTDNGGDPDSYIPDFDSNNTLTGLVNFTIANLFEIAIGAKQERIVYLEVDSNLIIQTHRFYGLIEDDSTIDEFIRNNKIGLSEILQLKKGRQLKYYV